MDVDELSENAPMFVVESNASFNSKKYAMYNNEHVFSDGGDTGTNNGGVTPELMKNFVDAYFGGELNEAHNSGSVPSSKWVPGYVRKVVWRTLIAR